MITFSKAFVVDGETFASLRDAQISAIKKIIGPKGALTNDQSALAAGAIVDAADQVVCALTTTERSKPRARRQNGGSKPRKPKTPELKLAAS